MDVFSVMIRRAHNCFHSFKYLDLQWVPFPCRTSWSGNIQWTTFRWWVTEISKKGWRIETLQTCENGPLKDHGRWTGSWEGGHRVFTAPALTDQEGEEGQRKNKSWRECHFCLLHAPEKTVPHSMGGGYVLKSYCLLTDSLITCPISPENDLWYFPEVRLLCDDSDQPKAA